MYYRSCLTPPPTPLQLSNLVLSMTSGHRDMRVVNPSSFCHRFVKAVDSSSFSKENVDCAGSHPAAALCRPSCCCFWCCTVLLNNLACMATRFTASV